MMLDLDTEHTATTLKEPWMFSRMTRPISDASIPPDYEYNRERDKLFNDVTRVILREVFDYYYFHHAHPDFAHMKNGIRINFNGMFYRLAEDLDDATSIWLPKTQHEGAAFIGCTGCGKTTKRVQQQRVDTRRILAVNEAAQRLTLTNVMVLPNADAYVPATPESRLYSKQISAAIREGRLNPRLAMLAAEDNYRPIISGGVVQVYAAIYAYGNFDHIPEELFQLLKLLPWQPTYVYLRVPAEERRQRIEFAAQVDPNEYTRREAALKYDGQFQAFYEQFVVRAKEHGIRVNITEN